MKYLIIFLVVLVIFFISITVGARNGQVVTVNYLLAQGDFRVSTLLASLFVTGFLLGWSICALFLLRVKMSLAYTQYKLKRLQQQQTKLEII